MRATSMLAITSLLIIVIFFNICCGSQKGKGGKEINITAVEMYCTCLQARKIRSKTEYSSDCIYDGIKDYSTLVYPKTLFTAITNKDTIEKLRTLFYESEKVTDFVSSRQDPRFLVLFKKGKNDVDTFSFYQTNPFKFYYNERKLFTYQFNILDSIANVLGKEKIQCN
jgi:hypothetical protein